MVFLEIEEPTAEENVWDIEEPKLWTLTRLGEADPDRKPFMDSGLPGSCTFDESEDLIGFALSNAFRLLERERLIGFGLSKAFRLLERERCPALEPGRLIFSCHRNNSK